MKSDLLREFKFNKKVLLTGAGFTKDFGGYLAEEMWSFIFNSRSFDKYPRIKNLLRTNFSYESFYHEIIESEEYSDGEKRTIKEAVQFAYNMLNENIKGCMNREMTGTAKANSTSLTTFINNFHGKSNETGFFFTLNQDIFVERYCRNNGLATPGIPLQGISYTEMAYQQMPVNLTADDFKRQLRSSQFNYVKLHGSYHWRDSRENIYMVIGKSKEEQISKEPLIKLYSELFEEVLSHGDVELFIIGYGFVDQHINKVIADSVNSHGLKLYVMDPNEPKYFKDKLPCKLWDKISGYFPYSISTVFPPDKATTSSSIEYQQIIKDFFGRD